MASQKAHVRATSSPISRHVRRDVYQRVVPGCSKGEYDGERPVLISNTMLQAYNKMRGPVPDHSPEDPLFEWIHLREDISAKDGKLPPSHNKKRDILRMLRKVDETLSEGNAAGDSPREAVFEINRPAASDHHISAPPHHDFSTHVLTACCADFEFESDDSDDEESSVPHGRISPCTFLAWSKGCRPWDVDRLKVPIEESQSRQRPPTPDLVDTPPYPPRPFRYPGWAVERQICESTGCELSPCYAVPPSPSLMYEPEGIDVVRAHDPTAFAGRYSRMDPEAGKALRKLVLYYRPNAPSGVGSDSGGTSDPGAVTADGGDEEYSHSKIEALLNSPSARPPHTPAPGLPIAPHLAGHLSKTYATIAANEAQVQDLTQTQRHQAARIQGLLEERGHLAAAVGMIQSRRQRQPGKSMMQQLQKQQVAAMKTPEEKNRERRIRKHVAAHIADVQYKSIEAADALGQERMNQETNDASIVRLQGEIVVLCNEVGLKSPAEVYDELAAGNGHDDAATQTPRHYYPGNDIKGHEQNVQEAGASQARVNRDNAQSGTFPAMPRQQIITTITPRSKSTQTPRQHVSPSPAPAPARVPSPFALRGAFSPPREQQTPHNGGEFEDDPLPRLRSQYLEIMRRTNSSSDGLSRTTTGHPGHGLAIFGNDDGNQSSGYGAALQASPTTQNSRLRVYGGGADPSPYEADVEGEGEGEFDEAEYLAVERMLESTEAFLERLQKKH
ncbi:hypothetical protein PG985_009185 [Apiospora marii]|uniref:uncharacterized protein n=1 Tax=Apiospora marii TaxID=335849 RepID=UPI003132273D